jgi:acetyl esterase/lipase
MVSVFTFLLLEKSPISTNVKSLYSIRNLENELQQENDVMTTKFLFLAAILTGSLFLSGSVLYAQQTPPPPGPQQVEPLWPGGAPLAKGDQDVDKPSLTIYMPSKDIANGAAVVVCPGGGYIALATDHEGRQVAQWLNAIGVAAYMLQYRHAPDYNHPAPLLDAQRAIRTVRARAQEYAIDPARIGILGFSAGGHLTSSAGTHFDSGNPEASDPIDKVSCRPDFIVLIYPVISFTTEYTHVGSRRNLLGENPDENLVNLLSNELQVTKDTPPAFLVHTSADAGVPAENSVLFYLAMRKAGVPAEMHIFEHGPHGFGLFPKPPIQFDWPSLCEGWMKNRGLMGK